jgi:methylated-DNA-protein-cysteine methyltransferase related protein
MAKINKMTERSEERDFFERVYEIVDRIPAGRVTTYGAIARHLGTGGSARMVGWALNKTLAGDWSVLPCHRVVNRNGELTGKAWFGGDIMEQLLRSEGVAFDEQGRVDMSVHYWEP